MKEKIKLYIMGRIIVPVHNILCRYMFEILLFISFLATMWYLYTGELTIEIIWDRFINYGVYWGKFIIIIIIPRRILLYYKEGKYIKLWYKYMNKNYPKILYWRYWATNYLEIIYYIWVEVICYFISDLLVNCCVLWKLKQDEKTKKEDVWKTWIRIKIETKLKEWIGEEIEYGIWIKDEGNASKVRKYNTKVVVMIWIIYNIIVLPFVFILQIFKWFYHIVDIVDTMKLSSYIIGRIIFFIIFLIFISIWKISLLKWYFIIVFLMEVERRLLDMRIWYASYKQGAIKAGYIEDKWDWLQITLQNHGFYIELKTWYCNEWSWNRERAKRFIYHKDFSIHNEDESYFYHLSKEGEPLKRGFKSLTSCFTEEVEQKEGEMYEPYTLRDNPEKVHYMFEWIKKIEIYKVNNDGWEMFLGDY